MGQCNSLKEMFLDGEWDKISSGTAKEMAYRVWQGGAEQQYWLKWIVLSNFKTFESTQKLHKYLWLSLAANLTMLVLCFSSLIAAIIALYFAYQAYISIPL